MIFKTPLFLLLIPILLIFCISREKRKPSTGFHFSSGILLKSLKPTWKMRFIHLPRYLRYGIIFLFCFALAGPRIVIDKAIVKTEGIDILLAIDSSGSMAAEDFKINGKRKNRLHIIKEVVIDFIEKRQNDRIGLIAFAGLAYTVCPLTTDYTWIVLNLERVEMGLIKDGTAVGSAIASSLSRLKDSEAKSKIVILLTDGVNNVWDVDPIEAARAAKHYGVKIYTIGAGSTGPVPYPTNFFGKKVYQNVMLDLDEKTLEEIADITGGKYYRATDTSSLRKIYEEIDRLEKTEIEEYGYYEYTELFEKFLLAAIFLLIIELILRQTSFLKIP